MAKTIKFNLVCDGHQVRTLKDLSNHFSIEDVLQYFRDKVLEKWLCVRGYNEEFEAVQKITATNPYDIIKELVSIFKVESAPDRIEYSTSIITYRESRILADQRCQEKLAKSNALYSDYFKRYEDLTNEILENPTNKSKIQGVLSEIENQYAWIFEHDYRNFFYKVKDVAPLAILCLLMNQFTRKFYIFDDEIIHDNALLYNRDIKEMCKMIKEFFLDVKNFAELVDAKIIKVISQNTNNYPMELSDSSSLIIKMDNQCSISEKKNGSAPLVSKNVNNKFLIMESLRYVSASDNSNTLYYIEK